MDRPSESCDVLVAGAGPSGIAAAVAAARSGCRVLLVEKSDRLGGIAVQAPLHRLCGLYGTEAGGPPTLLNSGLVEEVVSRLRRLRPFVSKPIEVGKVHVLPFRATDLEGLFADMVSAEDSLAVSYNTRPVSVSCHGGRIERVVLDREGTWITVTATALVDATGNAALSALAEAPVLSSDAASLQMGGYVVQVDQCEDDAMTGVRVPYCLHEAVQEGRLPPFFRFTAWEPEENAPRRGFLKFSVPPTLGDAETVLQREADRAIACLQEKLPAFRSVRVRAASGRVLAREGRRISGEYVLTEADVLGGRKFADGIVKNAWPVEFWSPLKGPLYKYVAEGDHYEIPFGCLRPVGVANLLATGTCLSATQAAYASARVMGPCISLGDQAGRSAALFAGSGQWPYRVHA